MLIITDGLGQGKPDKLKERETLGVDMDVTPDVDMDMHGIWPSMNGWEG